MVVNILKSLGLCLLLLLFLQEVLKFVQQGFLSPRHLRGVVNFEEVLLLRGRLRLGRRRVSLLRRPRSNHLRRADFGHARPMRSSVSVLLVDVAAVSTVLFVQTLRPAPTGRFLRPVGVSFGFFW